ncbi:vesicle-associated membrane protein [Auriculariales sp. MPI-PUGE-AT-0066]|nr:vesicle-associated membrane protein [Auriculariales sp. MPI-PUGE-AT-0066]
MLLVTSTVSRGADIVASHATGRRDFSNAEQYLIHYFSQGGTMYLVLTDEATGRRLPSAYLSELQVCQARLILSSSSSFHDFELRLAELMKYNENPPKDKLGTARNDLDLVKDIMVRQILIFGERIELLIDKTDHLSGQAYAFRRGARTVRRQQFWRNQKILAIGIFAGLFFFYILVAQFCGVGLNHCSG